MKQQALTGFEKYGKTTRRAEFLADMDRIEPWTELQAGVEPVYPKLSEAGPPAASAGADAAHLLAAVLFNLPDPAKEEALCEPESMRESVGIDLGQEAAPDETTASKFRHLLERNKLGKKLLSTVNGHLARNGIKIGNGTIVAATIIGAPSFSRNTEGKRDPDMHQVAKGKQWYFGMKAHVRVDRRHKIIHAVLASAANVSDVLALPHVLHGRDACVWGDQAYQGHTGTVHSVAPHARDCADRRYRFDKPVDAATKAGNCNKSRVRTNVEHGIGLIKRIFGIQKVRYRGLAKNLDRLEASAALANLFTVRRRLLAL